MTDYCRCEFFNVTNNELSRSGFYGMPAPENGVICLDCGWKTQRKLSLDHINFMHKILNPSCGMSKYITENYTAYLKSLQCVQETEAAMLNSFKTWTTSNCNPTPEQFVNAGFYFTGHEDELACIECNVILKDWTINDDPIKEHLAANPTCELLKLKKFVHF